MSDPATALRLRIETVMALAESKTTCIEAIATVLAENAYRIPADIQIKIAKLIDNNCKDSLTLIRDVEIA